MFDAWLQDMMDRRGVAAHEVAEACEVKESTVSRWLAGISRPERRQVGRLAQFLKVNPDVIMRMTDPDILRETIEDIDQHDLSAVLIQVPELRAFMTQLAGMKPERRAALIVIARALAADESE